VLVDGHVLPASLAQGYLWIELKKLLTDMLLKITIARLRGIQQNDR
jgi:hypothetical protein